MHDIASTKKSFFLAGMTRMEKLTIAQGICGPLLRKIRGDLQRNIETEESESDCVNRLNPRYSSGVSSPGRHVRTRLYFTSESHIHSLLTIIAEVGLVDVSLANTKSGIGRSRLFLRTSYTLSAKQG